ncbi:GH3 family domain-containing protein [Oleiharenicola lentus]|uniref:GH3 family domain-containing protein n=1 Tax=Oleiharenicola lentus TaxID=2508720 RepID=UPI003F664258
MTLAPRFLVNLWAGYRASKFARQLKSSGYSQASQKAAFAQLMAQFGSTEFGRVHRLKSGTSYDQFRDQVPPRTHEYFRPLIERMLTGEANVLTPGRCQFFVETAGTTGDTAKVLPVPEEMLAHFRHGLRDSLLLYSANTGHAGVFLGRQVHIGNSTALKETKGIYRTSLDGMLALCLSPWTEANLYAPSRATADLPEGKAKTTAVAREMVARDVTLVGGTPTAILALAQAVRDTASSAKRRMTHLQAVWPNLECCAFTGASLGLFAEALRASLGPTVHFHEIYSASEGIFAAQDEGTPTALRLLTDTGIFFEFLPLRRFSEESLAHAGTECVPLEKVQAGVDYVIIVTTPAGLCRYVTGDIVRFVSTEPPRLQFAGRTRLQLNKFGEHVSERELLETLVTVCHRNGWQAVNFHVAPLSVRPIAGKVTNSHEWWVELRTHTHKTPTANVLAPEFDAELTQRNPDYAAKRASQGLDEPTVRLVMPGIFDHWAQTQRQSGGTGRMLYCRSDRKIADQLSGLTRFHTSGAPFPTPGA